MVFSEMNVEELEHECDFLSFMYDHLGAANRDLRNTLRKEYEEKWGIIPEGY